MALLSKTQEAYYNISQSFSGNGSTKVFTLTTAYFSTLPTAESQFDVFIDGTQVSKSNYSYSSPNLTFTATDYNSTKPFSRIFIESFVASSTQVTASIWARRTNTGMTVQLGALKDENDFQGSVSLSGPY